MGRIFALTWLFSSCWFVRPGWAASLAAFLHWIVDSWCCRLRDSRTAAHSAPETVHDVEKLQTAIKNRTEAVTWFLGVNLIKLI
jgi:hypothetical protein